MRQLVRDYTIAVGAYLALLLGGVVATLTISSAVGYLPYSDRPGPDWYQPSISLQQVTYYLSWAALLLLPCLIYGTGIFIWLRLLQLLGTPRVVIRAVGGIVSGVLSMFLIAAGGWYIAVAAFPVWVAGGLGAVWAAVIMPRYLGTPLTQEAGWAQRSIVVACLVAMPTLAAWAFFVPKYTQELNVLIIRVSPEGSGPIISDNWKKSLEPHEVTLLGSLFSSGVLHSGIRGGSGSGGGGKRARMLVIVTGPVPRETRLRVPKGVSVVYVQRDAGWDMYPPEAQTLRDTIRLEPGADIGVALFAWPHGEASPFRWYPPLK